MISNLRTQAIFERVLIFDTPTSRFTQLLDGTSQAVGPLYVVDFSNTSRICAYFIPRGVGVRKFYPLMPPKGSFHHSKADWTTKFKTEFHLSDEQAREGIEVLSRAGTYQTIVPSRTAPDYEERVSVTVIGDPPDDEHINVTMKVIRILKNAAVGTNMF